MLSLRTRELGDGVIELEADSIESLGLGSGEWMLVVAVGPVEALPRSIQGLAPSSGHYEIIERTIRVVAPDDRQ